MKRFISYMLIVMLITTCLPKKSWAHLEDAKNYMAWNEELLNKANKMIN